LDVPKSPNEILSVLVDRSSLGMEGIHLGLDPNGFFSSSFFFFQMSDPMVLQKIDHEKKTFFQC
jgi:hypothetical protein